MTDNIVFKSAMDVDLIDSMGGDESIVRFARVSSGTNPDEAKDAGLIRYLMKSRHGSPFESPVLQYKISCPIFVAREYFRHRIASYNEVSGRYRELEPVFYVPSATRNLKQIGKPGAYTFSPGTEAQVTDVAWHHKHIARVAWQQYKEMLDGGVAREVARNVLPLSIYTSFYVNFNLRSLMNFLSLRMVDPASTYPTYPLEEIAQVAEKMDTLAYSVAPVAMAAFSEFGRVAP